MTDYINEGLFQCQQEIRRLRLVVRDDEETIKKLKELLSKAIFLILQEKNISGTEAKEFLELKLNITYEELKELSNI